MTAFQITQTSASTIRKTDSTVAFFNGKITVDGRPIPFTTQTKIGDAAQYRIEGGSLLPLTSAAEAAIAAASATAQQGEASRIAALSDIPTRAAELVTHIKSAAGMDAAAWAKAEPVLMRHATELATRHAGFARPFHHWSSMLDQMAENIASEAAGEVQAALRS